MLRMLTESDNLSMSLPPDTACSEISLGHSGEGLYESQEYEQFLEPLSQNNTDNCLRHIPAALDNNIQHCSYDQGENEVISSLGSMSISNNGSSKNDSYKDKDRSNHDHGNIVNNIVNNKNTNFTFNTLNNNNNNIKMEDNSKFIPIPIPSSSTIPPPSPPLPPPLNPVNTSSSPPNHLTEQSFSFSITNTTKEQENKTQKKGRGRPKKSVDKNILSSPLPPSLASTSSSSDNDNNSNVKRKKGRPRRTFDSSNITTPDIPIAEPPPLHVNKKCGINLSDEIKEWFEDVCSKKTVKKNLPIPNEVIDKYKKIKDLKVKCYNCDIYRSKLDCFLIDRYKYICYECAGRIIKKDEAKRLQHWENEVKDGKGLCCQRLTHWYPVHDFVETKNCDEGGKPLKGEAYKSSQQCIFCRNFKKYEYRVNNSKK